MLPTVDHFGGTQRVGNRPLPPQKHATHLRNTSSPPPPTFFTGLHTNYSIKQMFTLQQREVDLFLLPIQDSSGRKHALFTHNSQHCRQDKTTRLIIFRLLTQRKGAGGVQSYEVNKNKDIRAGRTTRRLRMPGPILRRTLLLYKKNPSSPERSSASMKAGRTTRIY